MTLILPLFLVGLAVAISLAAGIWLLVLAFRRHVGWGLAVLFVPLANLVFIVVAWAEAKRPFLLALAAIPLAVGAIFLLPREQVLAYLHAQQAEAAAPGQTVPSSAAAPPETATAKGSDLDARLDALRTREAGLLERKRKLDPKDQAAALALSREIVAYNAELQAALAAHGK